MALVIPFQKPNVVTITKITLSVVVGVTWNVLRHQPLK